MSGTFIDPRLVPAPGTYPSLLGSFTIKEPRFGVLSRTAFRICARDGRTVLRGRSHWRAQAVSRVDGDRAPILVIRRRMRSWQVHEPGSGRLLGAVKVRLGWFRPARIEVLDGNGPVVGRFVGRAGSSMQLMVDERNVGSVTQQKGWFAAPFGCVVDRAAAGLDPRLVLAALIVARHTARKPKRRYKSSGGHAGDVDGNYGWPWRDGGCGGGE